MERFSFTCLNEGFTRTYDHKALLVTFEVDDQHRIQDQEEAREAAMMWPRISATLTTFVPFVGSEPVRPSL